MEKITKQDFENFKKSLEESTPFTTGFVDLDEFLTDIKPGNIITIGARPSVGKTMFAIAIVNNLLKENKKVCYFSLAQSKESLYTKFIMNLTKIIGLRVRIDNKRITPDMLDAMNNAADELAKRELYIKDKTVLSTNELEEDIIAVKPDIVVIDYIQLLKMPKAPNLTEATNLAIHEVKRIAEENNVIVILISQLSRAVETRESKIPMLSDLRNGSLLEELSDVVLFIHREDYYNLIKENIPEEDRHKAEIIISKNRDRMLGSFNLNCNGGIFSERRTINVIDL